MKISVSSALLSALLFSQYAEGFNPSKQTSDQISAATTAASSRREWFQHVAVAAASASPLLTNGNIANAATGSTKVTGAADGTLGDLPPEAIRSYLQYRIPLQTSADFYLFELQPKLNDVTTWGEIGELFQVNSSRGGSNSRMEREFTNTFRILGLSMPPDIADEMRDAQFRFERSLQLISKATAGIRRDLPVEIDKDAVPKALAGWEEGRLALNDFFTTLNAATGLNEMKTLPPIGPNQLAEYGRSEKKYVELKKKAKLCQNRGGPTLSVAWGQLMVSGYMQDSCGIPDLEDYFYQT